MPPRIARRLLALASALGFVAFLAAPQPACAGPSNGRATSAAIEAPPGPGPDAQTSPEAKERLPDVGGPIVLRAANLARAYELVGAEAPERDLVIPESEVRLALVTSLGATELELRKLDVYVSKEIARRVAEGADASEFEIGDADVDASVNQFVEGVRQQYPTLDPADVLRSNQLDPPTLRAAARRTQLFQRVFMPADTSKWPQITMDAVTKHLGEAFAAKIDDLFGAPVDPANPQPNQGRAIMQKAVQDAVVRELASAVVIREADYGLPEGVAMVVDDVEIRTDDVLAAIAGRITPDDLRRARAWAVKSRLAEELLRAAGAWLDDEEYAAAYEEHERPYVGTMLPLEIVAKTFKRFPSMVHYKRHFRITASFERFLAPELTTENLEQHLVRARRMLGLETVDAEVILLSAYDFKTGQWKPDGWRDAERRAREVIAALAEKRGENWTELLEAHSDFWDPPVQAPAGQAGDRLNKGRLGPMNRNRLAQILGENEYRQFVEGGSVADAIFFDVPTGGVDGPWRGPFGYYIAYVKARRPAEQHITLGDHADLVRQDFVATRLNAFMDDAVRRAGG